MDTQTQQRQEIQKLMKQESSRRMFERYQSILLFLQGMPAKEIAGIIGRTAETVNAYIKAYKTSGVSGLQMTTPSGRPDQLTPTQQDELKATIINKLPVELGFTAKHSWTLQLIRDHIEQTYQQTFSIRGTSKLMHRMNLSYTKPTYTLAAADEAKQVTFLETTLPELKKSY
jgi:transposase